MEYIDFHAHIFPDRIAGNALERLTEHSGEYKPRTDGTLNGLLRSMDEAGISISVVSNIATRPSQTIPIYEFSLQVRSKRIYPLISIHPENNIVEAEELLSMAKAGGIIGVKLHPMYQEFYIDEKRMFPFYDLIRSTGLFVLFHTGYDIAFPGNDQADVERVRRIAGEFRDLTIIATHVGGWRQWERIDVLTGCENIYTETSMTLTEIDDDAFVRAISRFDEDRLLFGTDSPWTDQKEMLERTLRLDIPDRLKEKMLYGNAAGLIGML